MVRWLVGRSLGLSVGRKYLVRVSLLLVTHGSTALPLLSKTNTYVWCVAVVRCSADKIERRGNFVCFFCFPSMRCILSHEEF